MYEKEEYNVIQRRDMSTIHIHTMYEREEYSVKHSVKIHVTYNVHTMYEQGSIIWEYMNIVWDCMNREKHSGT